MAAFLYHVCIYKIFVQFRTYDASVVKGNFTVEPVEGVVRVDEENAMGVLVLVHGPKRANGRLNSTL